MVISGILENARRFFGRFDAIFIMNNTVEYIGNEFHTRMYIIIIVIYTGNGGVSFLRVYGEVKSVKIYLECLTQ